MKAQEIRDRFTQYFQRQGHKKVSSSSLIPHNDPTLLFSNAGMNQFKDYFTGKAKAPYKRAVTIQKCTRAGGKHNDLENVGFTARHHTFFEMLGNFSFGDYFKEDAIRFAWEFLTQELKIPAQKLFITVHYTDKEAEEIWNKKIGVPLEKIFKKDKDNFWEMGEFGPCGPCSEIFYDHGEANSTPGFKPDGDKTLIDDEGRFVEIWNLVFMQFEKTPEGQFSLPSPCIDTGAGLERLSAAMQGTFWNYDTDLFAPIFQKLESLTGKSYRDPQYTSNMRVVADHIRASTMLLTDGVIPSNEGRGYVLRRIIRRAIRHLRELGTKEVTFYKLVPTVFEVLGHEYPQNAANASLAEKFLEIEEKKFLETLDTGMRFLREAMEGGLKKNTLPGEVAFKLYDTYGFPLDLTEVICREKNIAMDLEGFHQQMEKQKETSRKSWKGAGDQNSEKLFHEVKERFGATQFLGYEHAHSSATLLAKVSLGEKTALVFNQTPFYGESGGQVGDKGVILDAKTEQVLATIEDTQKPVDELFVHLTANADILEEGKTYLLKVEDRERALTARNHSATHLLQAALIQVVGDHIKQAGSLVNSEKLRFDFTHSFALSKEELQKVEDLVNEQIQLGLAVAPTTMNIKEAQQKGAMALFGEKYGEIVRVIQMGNFSTELCGGTHVSNTRDIGHFSILSESSLSSGVRRIEAVTSVTSLKRLEERSRLLQNLEQEFSKKGEALIPHLQGLKNQLKDLSRENEQLKDKIQSAAAKDLFSRPEEIEGFSLQLTKAPQDSDLRKLSDNFINDNPQGILVLYTTDKKAEGKISALMRVHRSNSAISCSDILSQVLKDVEGRGGGKPDMAQGSFGEENLEKFLSRIKTLIHENLKSSLSMKAK